VSSLTEFRDRYPEFVSVADSRVNVWLSVAARRLAPVAWGILYQDAALLLTAHFLDLSLQRQAAAGGGGLGPGGQLIGGITSVTTDRLSMSSGGVANRKTMDDNYFSMTEYGLAFLSLRDCIPTSFITINGQYTGQIFSNVTVPEDT